MPLAPADAAVLTDLLGREPRAACTIVVRDDGTPMPTRYWLVDPELTTRVSRLESSGGVRAAERAVDRDKLRAAHDAYASERDAEIAPDHAGPRPTGGVAGTRTGVKCLHAHYAYFLAGGDDPVGRWVAAQLEPDRAISGITAEDRR
jgi:hypothetical protein